MNLILTSPKASDRVEAHCKQAVNGTNHRKENCMKRIIATSLFLLALTVPAWATSNVTLPPNFTQSDFQGLSRDLGLAISYIPLAPAEPLGDKLFGIDIGVEATAVPLDTNSLYWQKINIYNSLLGNSTIPSTLPMPKVHVQLGLPVVPIDLGYVYSFVPGTDIKYMGGEIKYAILTGSTVAPALALRGAYTKLSGVPDLDMSTQSLDLSISKGFAIFTPYAGYAMVWIDSKPTSPLPQLATLQEEKLSEPKGFVGCRLTFFPLLNMVAEVDFARVNSYSLRLNLHF
jgi:hypothetical protein